jgi:hypothetical protein
MQCIEYNGGILFYKEGDNLKDVRYQQYVVFLRDCEKGLNGHFLLNYCRTNQDIIDAARERRTASNFLDDDEAKG